MNNRIIVLFKVIYILHWILLLILSAGRFLTNSIFQQQLYRLIIYYCLVVISTFWIVKPSFSAIYTREIDDKKLLYIRIFAITSMGTVIIKLIELFI